MIDENKYIDSKKLSKNLDKIIIDESKILKKKLKNTENFNFNVLKNYV